MTNEISDIDNQDFEELIEHIQKERGFDFRGYKRSSLHRRIIKRLTDVGIPDLESYRSYIEANPTEYEELLNTILINVTSFFRDAGAWKDIKTKVIPNLVARKKPDENIRIWSAGCATGEEPYSLAMLLAEELGEDRFRQTVKIYATDLDEEALEAARRAKFDDKAIKAIPKVLSKRYFDSNNGIHTFRREFRKSVIFGRHDIVNDAPISSIDLLVCRNVLIYLDSATQNKLLPLLHFALARNGVLFLGKAETLLIRSPLFETLHTKSRIFSKISGDQTRGDILSSPAGPRRNGGTSDVEISDIFETIIEQSNIAYLVLHPNGKLALANRTARRLFDLNKENIGNQFYDHEVSYYPVELRRYINEAIKTKKPIRIDDVDMNGAEVQRSGRNFPHLSIEVNAMSSSKGQHFATVLSFYDTTMEHQLREELQATNEAMETTNEELQSANEELETTNEELQSTNEELETTNEELQSTNEELETTNEELQSSNEELETTNEELHIRGEELDDYRNLVDATLGSIDVGFIIVDEKICATLWNKKCQELWGLSKEETNGTSLLNLDFGLAVEELKQPLKKIIGGKVAESTHELLGMDRRGRTISCALTLSALRMSGGKVCGAVLMIESTLVKEKVPTKDSTMNDQSGLNKKKPAPRSKSPKKRAKKTEK
jgi:two-component system, chemotaxis family, CheB/CheR fusion protein